MTATKTPSVPAPPSAMSIAEKVEAVLIGGDLSKLSVEERVFYYNRVCNSVGLNPDTRPFEYLTLSGKLQLYARKDCTDQLRRLHKISVDSVGSHALGDIYVVTTKVRMPDGRTDMATGAVALGNAKGELLANLMMKAETKSKRRATLAICGLGVLDESEVENIVDKPLSRPVSELEPPPHDASTGELLADAIPEWGEGPRDHLTPNDPPLPSPNSTPVRQATGAGTASQRTPHLAQRDAVPDKTESEQIAQYDRELMAAAEKGSDELRRAWLLIPTHHRKSLEAAAKNRHAPRARDVDVARRKDP